METTDIENPPSVLPFYGYGLTTQGDRMSPGLGVQGSLLWPVPVFCIAYLLSLVPPCLVCAVAQGTQQR